MTFNSAPPRAGQALHSDYPEPPVKRVKSWASYEHLSSSLPAGTTPIEELDPGVWVRYVKKSTGEVIEQDGQNFMKMTEEPRRVSLSLESAMLDSRTEELIPHDFWDGWTWWRNGVKSEMDMRVFESRANANNATYSLAPVDLAEPSRPRRARAPEKTPKE